MSQVGEQHKRLIAGLDLVRRRLIVLEGLIGQGVDPEATVLYLRAAVTDLHDAQVLAERIDTGEFAS